MLHIINKSPFNSNSLTSCLRVAASNSTILLIEDGVYAALANTSFADLINSALEKHSIYALKADIEARGLNAKIIPTVKIVDYDGFVDLTLTCHPIQSWS